jgi:hypothetical protein
METPWSKVKTAGQQHAGLRNEQADKGQPPDVIVHCNSLVVAVAAAGLAGRHLKQVEGVPVVDDDLADRVIPDAGIRCDLRECVLLGAGDDVVATMVIVLFCEPEGQLHGVSSISAGEVDLQRLSVSPKQNALADQSRTGLDERLNVGARDD